jgi:hypothetical protein
VPSKKKKEEEEGRKRRRRRRRVKKKKKKKKKKEEEEEEEEEEETKTQMMMMIMMMMNIFNSVRRSLPLASIHSRISPVHAFQTDLHNINFNIILPNTSRSCKWSLSVGFPHQNPVRTSHLHLGEITAQINN